VAHEQDQTRARQLQSFAIQRNLTDSELTEAANLVRDLMENDLPHAATWAYDAIRRTAKRKRKAGTYDHLSARSVERTALARLVKGGMNITPSHAPSDLTIGKTVANEKGFERRVKKVAGNIQKDLERLRERVVQEKPKE